MTVLKIPNGQGQYVSIPVIKGKDGVDGESIVGVRTEGNSFIFVSSAGREIQAQVPTSVSFYDTGDIDVTDDVVVGCSYATIRRVGNRVTFVAEDVNIVDNGQIFWPDEGYRIKKFTDQYGGERYRVIINRVEDYAPTTSPNGFKKSTFNPAGMWGGGFFWNNHTDIITEMQNLGDVSMQIDKVIIEWYTDDLPPIITGGDN